MTNSRSSRGGTAALSEELSRRLDEFDAAWQSGSQPELSQYLPDAGDSSRGGTSARLDLLRELVMTDLEYRWKVIDPEALVTLPPRTLDSAAGAKKLPPKPRLEDYTAAYPELGAVDGLPLALVAQEYRVRTCWGDRPRHEEYLERFPWQGRRLAEELARIDEELRSDASQRDATTERARLEQTPPDGSQPSSSSAPTIQLHAPPLPEKIGRYEIQSILGAGGFGVVYKAHDPDLDRDVAIKVPRPRPNRWKADADSYIREARHAARLDHPGIVSVYDAGLTDDGQVYVVSKLVSGTDLKTRLESQHLSPAEAARIVADVADALQHAHQQGLIHRDVKPANILIDAEGRAVLADFGLALKDEEFGRAEGLQGTPAYMSPEQARGEGHLADARTDIYSLGVVLYELLTGKKPFRSQRLGELIVEITQVGLRPPSQAAGDKVPEELDRICLRATARDPAARYPSAVALARDLRRFLSRTKSPDRGRMLAWGLAGASVAVVLAAALVVWGVTRPNGAVPAQGKPDAVTGTVAQPVPSAANRVDIYIHDAHDTSRRGFLRDNPKLAPLRTGDRVRLEARAARPSYLYLIWIDAEGVALPVYPWLEGDWSRLPSEQKKVDFVQLPEQADLGWPLTGQAGMETIVLLVRDEPLAQTDDLQPLLKDLPQATQPSPAPLRFVNGLVVADERTRSLAATGGARGFDVETVELNDPVFRIQALLKTRLGGLFQATTAISIPHAP